MNDTAASTDTELRSEIKHALNRSSAENPSGTPDHILADFLLGTLGVFEDAIRHRATWRGETTELPALANLNTRAPIDRDELKAVIVSAGDAPAEIADAVVAWLA